MQTAMRSAALALALATLASTATAAEPSATPPPPAAEAQALARKIQAFYERTRDLTAAFRQTYTYAGMGRRQVSSGLLQVKKPGMMRWEYQKPVAKVVAVKGSRLVQYEPVENQAYVDERFDATAMSAAVTFLLGKGELEKDFEPSLGKDGALVLRPRDADPRVETIELTAAPDGQITATRVVDGAGNVNEIAFTDVKRNTGLGDAVFEVKLPEGVTRIAPPGR
jgi:outer membrane lipoprotein carrier protein